MPVNNAARVGEQEAVVISRERRDRNLRIFLIFHQIEEATIYRTNFCRIMKSKLLEFIITLLV